jgi:hypothetical protein
MSLNFACIHGMVNTSSNVCECEFGWVDDNTLFHLNNCSLPSDALLALFICFGLLLALPCLIIMLVLTSKSKGDMKKIGIFACLSILAYSLCIMSLYLEGGMFESSIIFFGLVTISLSLISQSIVKATMMPIIALHNSAIQKSEIRHAQLVMWLIRILLMILCIVIAGICRSKYYNYFVLALILSLAIAACLSAFVQMRHIGRLISALQEVMSTTGSEQSQRYREIDLVLKQLIKARKGMKVYACQVTINQLLIVSLFFGFQQQFPYCWSIWPLLMSSHLPKYYICASLLRKHTSPSRDISVASSDKKQNNQKDLIIHSPSTDHKPT